MSATAQLTPMMAQYRRIKGELPRDALLLFRLGDFYEMFFEDAKTGAQLLNLALTSRHGVPMCGLPYHAANNYIGRLLKAGHKVAICEQTEEPKPGKLVNRQVTQILSPGTHFDERMLIAERNNFLAAVTPRGVNFGLAVIDLTTGDFLATELESETALLGELERLRPAEIVHPLEAATLRDQLCGVSARRSGVSAKPSAHGADAEATPPPFGGGAAPARPWTVSAYDDWTFAPETAEFTVRDHFKVAALDGFGLKNHPAAIGAAGGALHYLIHNLRRDVRHLTRISFYQRADYLVLDQLTLRHLEILEPLQRDAPSQSCLYGALNKTITPMGARRLRNWLSQPLATAASIWQRQETVARFIENAPGIEAFRAQLGHVRDLERTVGRLSTGSGNARDLVVLRQALEQIPALKQTLATFAVRREDRLKLSETETGGTTPAGLLEHLAAQLSESPELAELIRRAIVEEPPLALKEGGMIRDGFSAELDELRQAQRSGKDWLAKLQQDESEHTGITSLKVRFNSVFGYFIEVTKSNLDKVPPHYLRKQTIANGERFITPELKEMEGKILGAEERGVKLEYELFQHLRESVLQQLGTIQQTAGALAQLDVLAAFAEIARLHDYCRPEISDHGRLEITEGRHPVLEQSWMEERFVPNDTALATADAPTPDGTSARAPTAPARENPNPEIPQIALITGPNMAGKSTYIRQVALLTLLAHTGSFIPAKAARIDLVDRIFTRIGANDDLARGQSTFMVEMSETANILNHATSRSLVILDEIGRGTSTFDGLSLAWSIVEHLHNQIGAKTLFATHYHELTELAQRLPRLKNFNVAVREWHDAIVFLRKIVAGGTDKSYGIQVARLAGVPRPVVERAKEILANLEASELTPEGSVRSVRRQHDRDKLKQLTPPPQLDLFA